MANGILKNLNQSLEVTLRDNLDGRTEFTLMMAAASLRPQFEVLPVENLTPPKSQPALSALTLVDSQMAEALPKPPIQLKKRA